MVHSGSVVYSSSVVHSSSMVHSDGVVHCGSVVYSCNNSSKVPSGGVVQWQYGAQ